MIVLFFSLIEWILINIQIVYVNKYDNIIFMKDVIDDIQNIRSVTPYVSGVFGWRV